MFNSRKSLIGCALCVGLCVSSVFAVDLSKSFEQQSQKNFSSQDIFQGKLTMDNIYDQALTLAKQDEFTATQTALTQIVSYYARQSCTLSTKDIFYLLADSDASFNVFTQQIVGAQDTTASRSTAIQKAYKRAFACKKISTPNNDSYSSLQREIHYLYYQFLSSTFLTTAIVQDNYGEDLFRNGDPSDSPFDILVDIQSLGNLFFTTFQAPPTPLFYRLPKISPLDQQGASASASSSPSSSGSPDVAESGVVYGPRRTANAGSSTPSPNAVAPFSFSDLSRSPASLSTSSPLQVSSDLDVQHFLSTTDVQQTPSDFNFVVGNQCVSGTVATPSVAQQQDQTLTPQQYLSGISHFITTVDVQDIVNTYLISGFVASDTASSSLENLSNHGTSVTSGNSYAQQGFAGSSDTCVADCQRKPLEEQYACQQTCAKSCIKQCDGLPLDEKVLCVNKCACFMVSGPLGSGWKFMENMFNIKFCTEPVQFVYMQKGKTVTSLEGIFKGIYDVLHGLKWSGQTIKKTKTNEFFDLDILSKFQDALDFSIRFVFKPLFPQAPTPQYATRALDNQKLVKSVLGLSSADTHNAYLVFAHPAQDNASLSPDTSTNLKSLSTLSDALAASQDTVALYSLQKSSFLSEDILNFLEMHQKFWQSTFAAFLSMMQDASSLEDKINQAP